MKKKLQKNKLLLNNELIEKDNLKCEFSKDYEYYLYINYEVKKFYLMTKKKNINKYNSLYYYCLNYRTTKNSEIYAYNNKK